MGTDLWECWGRGLEIKYYLKIKMYTFHFAGKEGRRRELINAIGANKGKTGAPTNQPTSFATIFCALLRPRSSSSSYPPIHPSIIRLLPSNWSRLHILPPTSSSLTEIAKADKRKEGRKEGKKGTDTFFKQDWTGAVDFASHPSIHFAHLKGGGGVDQSSIPIFSSSFSQDGGRN